jgi:hypothetical protein
MYLLKYNQVDSYGDFFEKGCFNNLPKILHSHSKNKKIGIAVKIKEVKIGLLEESLCQ